MNTRGEKGVALILVILVLSALILIGTPFVRSMLLHEQSARQNLARRHAEITTSSARAHVVADLMKTHETREFGTVEEPAVGEGKEEGEKSARVIPRGKFDGADEIAVSVDKLPIGGGPEARAAQVARGSTATRSAEAEVDPNVEPPVIDVRIEDEQGKINLNSASPTLMGNLLGGSILSAGIDGKETTTEIPVSDTSPFQADDDPETVDGVVVIMHPVTLDAEALSYRGKTATHLTGCRRGEYLSFPRSHESGSPIFDVRGYKVFLHRYGLGGDEKPRSYRTPSAIREIAEWSIVPFFIDSLGALEFELGDLEEYGVTPEMLVRMGLDKSVGPGRDAAVDPKEYAKAKKALQKAGVKAKTIALLEKRGGKAAVIRTAKTIGTFEDKKDRKAIAEVLGKAASEDDKDLKDLKNQAKKYFRGAIEACKQIYKQPGLETFTAHDFEQIRDLITTTSSIPSEWSSEQPVLGEIVYNPIARAPVFRVASTDAFSPGTLVRVRSLKDASKVEYRLAWMHGRAGTGTVGLENSFQHGVMLRSTLEHEYEEGEAVVATLRRHPININTAPRRVMEAVFLGLRMITDSGRGVNNKEARALTDYLIKNMPIHGFGHFRDLIEYAANKKIIKTEHVQAILTNALNPNHPFLSASTAGFCFVTGDIYAVESLGIVNKRAGVEAARSHARDVIDVAPPGKLFIDIANQDDWQFRAFSNAAPDWTQWDDPGVAFPLPGRAGNLMISLPVPLHRRGFEIPDMVTGSLKALTTESTPNAATWSEIEHFPLTIEGSNVAEDGPVAKSTLLDGGGAPAPPSGPAPAAAANVMDLITRPGCVEFWARPTGDRSGDIVLFESLADRTDPQRNRIRLYLDGDSQELVFQIMDDAAPPLGVAGGIRAPSGDVIGGGEIRHRVTPATFANDTWYHIMAAWGSTYPGDQALYIDGRPVGKNHWMTRLSSMLQVDGERISVEDDDVASRFPARGTLLVGTEAIDYDEIEGSTFKVRKPSPRDFLGYGRGVRGTIRQLHPQGTSVRLFGYAVDIGASEPSVPLAASGDFMLVGIGGAKLKSGVMRSMYRDQFNRLVPYKYARAVSLNPLNAADTTIACTEDPGLFGFPPTGYIYVQRVIAQAGGSVYWYGDGEYMFCSGYHSGGNVPGHPYQFMVNRSRTMLTNDMLLAPANQPEPGTPWFVIYSVSIETDQTDLDKRYPPAGIIQLERGNTAGGGGARRTDPLLADVEWIHYGHIRAQYLVAHPPEYIATRVDGSKVWVESTFRGWTGESREDPNRLEVTGRPIYDVNSITDHPAQEEIFPVIRLARPCASMDDYVSIGDTEGDPDERVSERRPLRLRKVKETGAGVYASFYPRQGPENTYWVRGNPKMKRFPSGELPARTSGLLTIGGPADERDGQKFEGVIDEIRLSRVGQTGVEITPFPLDKHGRLQVDDVPAVRGHKGKTKRAVVPWYRKGAKVGDGGELDKILLLGQSTLELVSGTDGAVGGRNWTWGSPRRFAEGSREGVFSLNGEAFHYTVETDGDENQAVVLLRQNLPRDPEYVDAAPEGEDDLKLEMTVALERDLRAEVVRSIKLSTTAGLPPRDGFLEFFAETAREVIYYERASGDTIYNCLRGQLGTDVGTYIWQWNRPRPGGVFLYEIPIYLRVVPRQEIDLRARGMLGSEAQGSAMTRQSILALPNIPITRLTGTPTETTIEVLSTAGFAPRNGYFILDDGNSDSGGDPNLQDEIIGYTSIRDPTSFQWARDSRTGKPLLRGRFGTPSNRTLAKDVAIVAFPARYHDHYEVEAESPALGYMQRSYRIPGARWDSVRWEDQKQRNAAFKNEVRVAVRFDGAPDWDAKPTNEPGGLYLFTDAKAKNRLDQEADLMEVRVYFRYPPGSYGRLASGVGGVWCDDWKHSPVLDSLTIEYQKPWRVLYHEELPY